MSFELDSGVDTGTGTGPFDNHSTTVSSDSLGSLTVHGHGGSNAAAALDTTAAGDLWDNTLGISSNDDPDSAVSGDGLIVYTLPTLAEGVAVSASYATAGEAHEGSAGFSLTYTGVEGLSVSYGKADDNGTVGTSIDQTVMKASYAYGPITVGYSNNDYDHDTAANDQETSSYNVSYTVSDALSISYGEETIDRDGATTADIEVSGYNVSYTSGGMTLSAKGVKADNVDYSSTATNNDNEMWKLAASFAF